MNISISKLEESHERFRRRIRALRDESWHSLRNVAEAARLVLTEIRSGARRIRAAI